MKTLRGRPNKFRHGDVFIKQIPRLPKGKRVEDNQTRSKILAYGEVTGHKHELLEKDHVVESFKILNRMYVKLLKETTITHEEHGPKILPPGTYEIRIAREVDHFSKVVRRVVD